MSAIAPAPRSDPDLQVPLVADLPELVAGVPVRRPADAVPLLEDGLRRRRGARAVAGVEAAIAEAVDQHGVLRARARADAATARRRVADPAAPPFGGAVARAAVPVLDDVRAVVVALSPVEHQALGGVARADAEVAAAAVQQIELLRQAAVRGPQEHALVVGRRRPHDV